MIFMQGPEKSGYHPTNMIQIIISAVHSAVTRKKSTFCKNMFNLMKTITIKLTMRENPCNYDNRKVGVILKKASYREKGLGGSN